jgi:hypothetical protein
MKLIRFTFLLSMLGLLSSEFTLARDNNQHPVEIPDSVKVGSAQLQTRQLQGRVAKNRPRGTGEFPA